MTVAVEHVKQEIRNLAPEEVDHLLRDLQSEYTMPLLADDYPGEATEAAWDAEIEERGKDVEEGRITLISGEESDRRITALFAKHGLQRRAK